MDAMLDRICRATRATGLLRERGNCQLFDAGSVTME
jgi:hypothetical protein